MQRCPRHIAIEDSLLATQFDVEIGSVLPFPFEHTADTDCLPSLLTLDSGYPSTLLEHDQAYVWCGRLMEGGERVFPEPLPIGMQPVSLRWRRRP
jgi:hypothetical protein